MKLFFRKYGNGPALIILHGLYGSSDNWVTIAKNLSDSFTVYLPDQRNHGLSPHSDIQDYDSMRDDLFEFVNDQSIRKFFLVGHSMGGKTAIAFALKWPELLNGLVVADVSPFYNQYVRDFKYSENSDILDAILSIDLKSIKNRNDAENELMKKIDSEKIRGFVLKNLRRTDQNSFEWKLNADALKKNLDKIMESFEGRPDINNRITGFPVIFIKGSKSDYITANDFEKILRIFPVAELIEIKDAGHWVHADNPKEVEMGIRKLLEP